MPRLLIGAVFLTLMLAQAVQAEVEDWLFVPFDADRLSWIDRRFVQMALSMNGDYVGMLDGEWGVASQRALERYGSREYGSGYASNLDVGGLILGVIERVSEEGWGYSYFEALDLSLLTPNRMSSAAEASDSGAFVNFNLIGSTLGYSLTIGDVRFTTRLHEFTVDEVAGQGAPYTVRKPHVMITSGETAAGKLFYTRSDLRPDIWATVMLSASARDRPLVGMVAASIRNGRTPEMTMEPDGALSRIVRATIAALAESERRGDVPLGPADPGATSRIGPSPDGQGAAESTGSGVFVGTGGEVLSNAHVVRGCRAIAVDGRPATVRATNDDFDLALIDTGAPRSEIAVFAPGLAALNADVTVIGYPLSGLLGGVNVTRGAVSSLSGLRGDATRMQISAPVQPGNSGGPVVDGRGAVIGIVVSKLDAKLLAEEIGDIPQNVNFAIRGEIARLFLSLNGVEPAIASETDTLAPEELAARMTKVTAFIECR